MKTSVYDKVAWHIDAGENKDAVLRHFSFILSWCEKNNLLSAEGQEIVQMGVDDSVSLHSRMFTEKGNTFMNKYYDEFISAMDGDESEMNFALEYV
jgi:Uri superfamily endonuclease